MKQYSVYICQQCNYQSPGFLGKCPECGEWNSLVETVTSSQPTAINNQQIVDLVKLSEVKGEHLKRISAGFAEFDRVLGGGIVPGSLVLISGDPGIGKSTLLLQSSMQIARGPVTSFPPVSARQDKRSLGSQKLETRLRADGGPSTGATPRKVRSSVNGPADAKALAGGQMSNVVLYVTGEESAHQVKIRADRIQTQNSKLATQNLYILPQTEVEVTVAASEKLNPTLLIVDSIQSLTTNTLSGSAGSVGQVRESAQILQRFAKRNKIPIFIVGHVTKEGNIAGPKVLEHLVDAVLALEGDGTHSFRILRSTKNRFGSTFEVGVFEMTDAGMVEVTNPSQIFLAQRIEKRSGSVVTSTIAGGRPLLCEVQALCTSTIFGVPARRTTGLDFSRTQIVIAALSRVANLPLGKLDIYLNVAGGLRISEPAADLAAALAIVSATVDKPVDDNVCAFGEVGLLGELRPVAQIKSRISEAKRMGFDDFVTPEKFRTLEQAIGYAIHGD